MKYLLLMNFPLRDWKTSRMELWPPQDIRRHMEFLQRFNQELVETGEFVRTEALGGPQKLKIVRASARSGWEAAVHRYRSPSRHVHVGCGLANPTPARACPGSRNTRRASGESSSARA